MHVILSHNGMQRQLFYVTKVFINLDDKENKYINKSIHYISGINLSSLTIKVAKNKKMLFEYW